eukprot:snap_masked-scaffold_53-processed-gene-0.19-mRNA-1 protein AED:1.00 eAED:1.00 QI:0/-1/0/0/-1/1/1/0/68
MLVDNFACTVFYAAKKMNLSEHSVFKSGAIRAQVNIIPTNMGQFKNYVVLRRADYLVLSEKHFLLFTI